MFINWCASTQFYLTQNSLTPRYFESVPDFTLTKAEHNTTEAPAANAING